MYMQIDSMDFCRRIDYSLCINAETVIQTVSKFEVGLIKRLDLKESRAQTKKDVVKPKMAIV